MKASDVHRTVEAYRLLSEQTDFPLHVGVTEAGGLYSGIVKSTLGIGMLLAEGIGDTIRVSLTRDPIEEVRVGYEILKGLDIRRHGPDIVSCPTCGRCNIDLFGITEKVEKALLLKSVPVKLAIMGCVVNGFPKKNWRTSCWPKWKNTKPNGNRELDDIMDICHIVTRG